MAFDISQFLNVTPGGPIATDYAKPKMGDHPGTVQKIEPRMAPLSDGPAPVLEVQIAQDGFNGPPSRFAIWLDCHPDGRLITSTEQEGANVALGQFYVACGRNPMSDPIGACQGARVLARYEPDRKDDRFTRITRVAPLQGAPVQMPAPAAIQPQQPAAPMAQPQAAPQPQVAQPQGWGPNGQQPQAPAAQPAPQQPQTQQPPQGWGPPQQ